VAASELDEAVSHAASELRRFSAARHRQYRGIHVIPVHERETFLCAESGSCSVWFNNVDTCARVCHSPTGYGLKHTLGVRCTQAFDSVMKTDVHLLIAPIRSMRIRCLPLV